MYGRLAALGLLFRPNSLRKAYRFAISVSNAVSWLCFQALFAVRKCKTTDFIEYSSIFFALMR
jgi:hypothetical protein